MMITSGQGSELLFILAMILVAAAMASYAIGVHVGRRHPAEDHQDPPPDLTVRLRHVPPTTAELFQRIEAEARYDTTPLGALVKPGYRQYGQERTTDVIARWNAETDEYIASWRRPESHPYPEIIP